SPAKTASTRRMALIRGVVVRIMIVSGGVLIGAAVYQPEKIQASGSANRAATEGRPYSCLLPGAGLGAASVDRGRCLLPGAGSGAASVDRRRCLLPGAGLGAASVDRRRGLLPGAGLSAASVDRIRCACDP